MHSDNRQIFSKFLRKKATLHGMAIAAATIILLGAGWMALANNPKAASPVVLDEVMPVESLQLKRLNGLETKSLYAGTIEAARGSELAFERPGRIQRVLVEEGQTVSRGQALAQLDVAELQMQLRQALSQIAQAEAMNRELKAGPRQEVLAAARAQVREAEEQLSLARAQESRREDLLRREAISREEMDTFRTQVGALAARVDAARQRLGELEAGTRMEQLDGQRAQVELARARAEEVRLQIRKSTLIAPFAGKIARRNLDEGAYAMPGTPVVELLETGKPEIRVGLPAEVAQALRPGEEYRLVLSGSRFEASVLRALPRLDEATRVVSVILDVPPAARSLALPGMLAQIEVPRRLDEAGYRVPVSALTRADRGLWACYAIGGAESQDGMLKLERREVEILHSDEEFAFVRGLIEDGDRIVAKGVNRVTGGQRVRVVKES